MATFFEHQDRARRNTRWLIVLMILAVVAMGGSIYALFLVLERYLGTRQLARGLPAVHFAGPQLFLLCLLGTAVIVVIASGSRVLSLRGGGASVAEMLGGRLISGSPKDSLEKRLLNVVEEMAIASGVPVPQVFVLDGEQGINAFAAGYSPDDAAIACTRGCLEKLTREQLQGVIAHEFSHVLNGDMRLNIRLMGVVFGIVCIGLAGRFLMRVAGRSSMSYGSYSSSSRRGRDNGGGATIAIFLFGLGVFLVGLVGELFGKLIKAAVSRQREFLADASAVQFTRNPHGIAGALQTIGGFSHGASMATPNAEEASHFFFGDIHKRLVSHSVFATHPPLAERIKRIDPSFQGEFPDVPDGIVEPEDPGAGPIKHQLAGFAWPAVQTPGAPAASGAPNSGMLGGAAAAPGTSGAPSAASLYPAADGGGPVSSRPQAVVTLVGVPGAPAIDEGRRLLGALPWKLRQAAQSPFSACAIVYALLLADDAQVRAVQRKKLDDVVGAELHQETLRMLHEVQTLARKDRLPLVTLLAPALRQLSRDQRATFTRMVQALIDADQAVSIFEYVVGETLRQRMEDSDAAQRSRVRHRTLPAVQKELQVLLSLLAHAGDFDGSKAGIAFQAGAARLRGVALQLVPASPKLLSALGPALSELAS
ncbi:MAG TPA: M48 family metallopeptidase, partial [Polyangiales bacterium]|nr:M48 family metallopeptidase [Polyangiales bacterium]